MAQDGGKVVSLTHRPLLPQEILLVLISIRGWVDPRTTVWSEGLCQWFQWFQWHSTLTTVLPRNRNEYQEYFLGGRRPVHRANKLSTSMCRLSWNLGASTSWCSQGLSRPVQKSLYLCSQQLYTWLRTVNLYSIFSRLLWPSSLGISIHENC